MLSMELDVLKQVHHPNLISLHDLFETKDAVYIITDLAAVASCLTNCCSRAVTPKRTMPKILNPEGYQACAGP
jgi:hypothetical protein